MFSNESSRFHREYPGFRNSVEPRAKEELATEFHRKNTENSMLIHGSNLLHLWKSVPLYLLILGWGNVNVDSPTVSGMSRPMRGQNLRNYRELTCQLERI